MNRSPDANVIKILRKESNFTCSIPGCEIPYLEFHHFDPPWHDRHHHEPEGMISLCPTHHRQADGGMWTMEQLREFKNKKEIDYTVSSKFDYLRHKFLLQAGGNYFLNNTKAEIVLAGHPIIWFEEDISGFKLLNIMLFDTAGNIYFHLDNNYWKIKDNVVDIECPPNGKLLRINFKNGNYVKIVFKELKNVEDCTKNTDIHITEKIKDILPITMISISLNLQEFNINFQSKKMIIGSNNISGFFSAYNFIGMALGNQSLIKLKAV